MQTLNEYILLLEEKELVTDIENHLKTRGVDLNKTRVVMDKDSNFCTFFIYNLSGKLIGFQRYNPNGDKKLRKNEVDNLYQKYYTYVTKEDGRPPLTAYGLETYKINSKILFITEGIFDCIKIHNCKYPAIALLRNAPGKKTMSWLKSLPQTKIVIADADDAGNSLAEAGDFVFTTPKPYKDLGEMPQNEVNVFIKNIVKNL